MSYSITLEELEQIALWASDQYDENMEKKYTHVTFERDEVILSDESHVVSKRPRSYFKGD